MIIGIIALQIFIKKKVFGQGTPEIPSGIIENKIDNVKQSAHNAEHNIVGGEKDDLIEINVIGVFDENSVINLENEFQDFFGNLAGNEVKWRNYFLSFYKPTLVNRYEVDFKTKCRFEEVGNKRAEIIECIHELGGIMGEIQSMTLASL